MIHDVGLEGTETPTIVESLAWLCRSDVSGLLGAAKSVDKSIEAVWTHLCFKIWRWEPWAIVDALSAYICSLLIQEDLSLC